eukprot:g1487.t1
MAMEDPMVGRIFMNKSIALEGEALPTLKGRLLEIEGAPNCPQPCTLDAKARSRIFNVGPGFGSGLILANLHLANAFARSGNGSAIQVMSDGSGGSASGFHVTLRNNTNISVDDGFGGAVWGGEHAMLGFDGSTFKKNAAQYGGSVACFACQLAVTKSHFMNNEGLIAGGSLYMTGNSSLSLSSSLLNNNRAGSQGGGAISLGVVEDWNLARAQSGMHDVIFRNNTAAGPGGAIRAGAFATIAMAESVLESNKGTARGGGLAIESRYAMALANTTFSNNLLNIDSKMYDTKLYSNTLGGAGLCIGKDASGSRAKMNAATVMNNVTFVGNQILKSNRKASRKNMNVVGAGVALLEGEVLTRNCHFEARNKNLNEEKEQIQDFCAFGKKTSALFAGATGARPCSTCGGEGHCAGKVVVQTE